jgi:alpha-tubulin suppressor-like RCC1 family protein
MPYSPVPMKVDTTGVLNGKKIAMVRAGGYFSMALDDQGDLYSWGMSFFLLFLKG